MSDGKGPLHLAASAGQVGIIRTLALCGGNVEAVEGNSDLRPIHCAAEHMQYKAVKALVKCGADMESTQYMGNTALLPAAMNWSKKYTNEQVMKTVQTLVDLGANVNAHNHQHTALMLASQNHHFELMQYLVDKKVDVNAEYEGNAALTYAVRWGDDRAIQLLLDNGARASSNIFMWVSFGESQDEKPRDEADIIAQCKTILGWPGATINGEPRHGYATLLTRAIGARIPRPNLVEWAISQGGEMNLPNKAGAYMGPMSYLSFEGSLLNQDEGMRNVAAILIKHGAKMEVLPISSTISQKRKSVMDLLIEKGVLNDTVRLFLQSGYDFRALPNEYASQNTENTAAKDGILYTNPLKIAIEYKNYNIIKDLVEVGKVSVTETDDNGQTPLHHAAKLDSAVGVQLLLQYGADKEAKDKEGRSPMDLSLYHKASDAKAALEGQELSSSISLAEYKDKIPKVLRISMIGNMGVGKTALVAAMGRVEWVHDFVRFQYPIDGVDLNFMVWDPQARDGQIAGWAFRSVEFLCFVFAVDNPRTFTAIRERWYPTYQKWGTPGIPCILIGNKTDLREEEERKKAAQTTATDAATNDEKRCVTVAEAEELAQQIGALCYLETSAPNRIGVDQLLKESIMPALKYRAANPLEDKDKKVSNKANDGCRLS